MRNLIVSFLFFYVCSFSQLNLYAQEVIDSTFYFYNMIIKPNNETDLSNGYKFYLENKIQKLIQKDTLGAIDDLRMISLAQYRGGLVYESEKTAVEALELLNELTIDDSIDSEKRISLYNHLGIIHKSLDNYDIALNYYDKILNVKHTLNQKVAAMNNKGNVFFKSEQYIKAIYEFENAYKINLTQNDTLKIARSLDNLGHAQSKINHPDALYNLEKSLEFRREKQYNAGVFTSYLHLTEYYKDRNDKVKALHNVNNAIKIANNSRNKKYILNALASKVELNIDIEVIEYKRLTDSISKAKQIQENKFSSTQYNFIKEKKRADDNKYKGEKEKRLRQIYQLAGAFILLLLILSYFFFKTRYKKNTLQQVYNTETRISKKVHDEVANDVYQIMTKLQADHISNNEALLDDLENVYIKTREISKENSTIDFKEDFNNLLNDLLLGYNGDNVSIVTKDLNIINWKVVPNLTKTAIYRVLQELMTNMRKHSKATIAILTFKKQASKIVIDYKDNGIGCNLKKQSGLQNAENRITSIKGTINFESEINKGFKAKIVV